MCDVFNRGALRLAVAQICQSMGWDSLQKSTQDLLTDVLQKYLEEIAKTTHEYCHHFCRTEPSLDDLGLAFDEIGIPVHELEDFVSQVDQVPFIHQLPRYPMPKGCVLHHPRNGEIVDRLEYYSDHLPPLIKVTEHIEDEGESLETKERSVNGDANGNEVIQEIKTVGEETSNELVSVKRPPESPPAYDGDVKRRRLDFTFAQKGLKTESELDILQALQDVSSPSSTPSPDIGMLPAFRFPEKPLSEGETLPLEKSQQSSETKTAKKEKKKPVPKVDLKSPPSKLKSPESKAPNSETPSKVKSPAKKSASNTTKPSKANKKKPKNPLASKSLPNEPKLKSPDKPSSGKSTAQSPIKSPLKSPPVKSPVKSPPTKLPVKSPPIKSPPFQSPPSKTKTAASSVPILEKSEKSSSTPPKSKAKQKPKPKAATDVEAQVQTKKKLPKKGKKEPTKPKSSALPEALKMSTKLAESSSKLPEGDLASPFVLPKLKIKPIKQEVDKTASYSISELIPDTKIEPSAQAGKDQKKKVKKPKVTASDGNTASKEKPQKKIKIKKVKSEPSSPPDIKSPPSKPVVKPITIALPAAAEPMFSISSLLLSGSSGTSPSVGQKGILSESLPHGFKKKKKKHKEKDKDKTKKKEKNKDKMHGHVKLKKEKAKETVAEPLPIPRLKLKLEPQATPEVVPPPEKKKKAADLPPEPEFSLGASTSGQHSSNPAQPLPPMLPYQGQSASDRIKEELVQRTVITETLSSTFGYGEQIYYCPTCGLPDDGSPMIGCEGGCDEWYHWSCVGILEEPSADSVWVCPNCAKLKEKKKKKKKKSKP